MKHFFWIVLAIGFLFSCGKNEPEIHETDFGYDYFPVELNGYRIYQVDSIIFAKGHLPDTISSQIKETITEVVDDKYILNRQIRKSPSDPWSENTTWWIVKEEFRLIQSEENLKFIKIPFPATVGKQWDGNAFFDEFTTVLVGGDQIEYYKSWSYEILATKDTITVNNHEFTDVLSIQEANSENAIELRESHAHYARNIGLVLRTQRILNTQCITCTDAWEIKAEQGVILTQKLVEWE